MPGDNVLNATRQLANQATGPACSIEIVKYIRTMFFDLGEKNIFQRDTMAQTALSCPEPLHFGIVAIREERPLGVLIDWQKGVSAILPEVHKSTNLSSKGCMCLR